MSVSNQIITIITNKKVIKKVALYAFAYYFPYTALTIKIIKNVI